MFLECVLFQNFSKKSKNFQLRLLATHSRVMLVASLLRRFRDSLVSKTSSREKHLEKFKKFLGFGHFRDYFAGGSLVASLLREVRDSLVSGCPSREKDLDKILKILYKGFWRLVLATCLRVI